jgi:outer membrane protein
MNRIRTLLAAAAFAVAFAAPAAVNAQEMRIAFVNTPQVLEQAPQADAVRATLESEFKPRDVALVADQKKVQALEDKLSRDGMVMSEEQRRKLEREILSQKREIKRARDEFTEDFNIRRNDELAKMQREIALSIVSLAKEKGYDLILENGVIYASDRVDITKDVIERLKRDYNKKNR